MFECFIFGFFPFHIKFFCILVSRLIIVCGTAVMSDRFNVLKIAKDPKLKTFPSIVKFLICHSLITISVFTIWF